MTSPCKPALAPFRTGLAGVILLQGSFACSGGGSVRGARLRDPDAEQLL